MTFLELVPLVLLTTPMVRVHDQLANGEPVPAWVKLSCCGPNDAHHLRPDQVHPLSDGWHIDGYRGAPVAYNDTLPSQDGEYWGFWVDLGDGSQTRIYCFFAPDQGT